MDVSARSGVRSFHTIDTLNAIEFFMKQVLKQGYYSILYSTNFNMTAAVLQSLES